MFLNLYEFVYFLEFLLLLSSNTHESRDLSYLSKMEDKIWYYKKKDEILSG